MGLHAYGAAYGMGYGAAGAQGGMPYMHAGMPPAYAPAHGSNDRVACTVYVTGVDTQVRLRQCVETQTSGCSTVLTP